MTMRTHAPDQVAIVGMAVMMPGAGNLETYWRNLVDGVDAITDVPAHRWDPEFFDPEAPERADRVYCRRGGFIDEFADFDPLEFGIMPSSIPDTDPDQLIALRVAAAAVDDAGGPDRLPAPDRVGVVLGRGGYLTPGQTRWTQRVRMTGQLVLMLQELLPDVHPSRLESVGTEFAKRLGRFQPEATIGLVPNLVASRVSNRLNLRGPAYTVDAACASSLLAVDHAINDLASGRCDTVVAGGIHHCHDIAFWSIFSQLRALSRRGQIRPFHADADGLLIGEGTGVVVLKRLDDAVRDGDRVYAVVRGSGVSSDGRSASLFNPESSGQALAIRRAWAMAGLDPTAPDAVGLLEAHGTATPTGDAAELATLAEVFGPARNGRRAVIGSVKSMIGHTMPAAGVAGMVKAALAVHHGVLLPTLHCDTPRAEIERTRFAPIAASQPWESDGPRRAGVNAFGFGGINAHVILEQAPEPAPARRRPATPAAAAPAAAVAAVQDGTGAAPAVAAGAVEVREPDRLLWLAGPDPAALARLMDADDAAVRDTGAARVGQPAAPGDRCRIGIADPTGKRLATARKVVSRGKAWRGGRDIWFSPAPLLDGAATGRIGFIYPGLEGDFSPRVDDVAAHFGLASRDWSAESLGRHGIGVVEVGRLLHAALDRIGIAPDAVAGHSIGEWTAGVMAGLVSEADVDGLLASFNPDDVEVPGVVYAAVGAGVDRVAPMLADYPGVVVSHENAPAQSIVCGPEAHVNRLVDALRENYILCQTLPFHSGFHTPMLDPYLGPVRAAADGWELHTPRVPVWSATTASPIPTQDAAIRALFLRHLVETVRFGPTIQAMHDAGIRVFLQVGTGQLASVMDDILREHDHLAVPVNVPHRTGLNQLLRVATALWVEGAEPDMAALGVPVAPAASAASTGRAAGRRGLAMKLDLGGALVRLGDGASGLLGLPAGATGSGAGSFSAAVGADPTGGSAALAELHRLSDRSAAAAELAALLRDTAHGAVTVLGAATTGTRPAIPRQRRPHPVPPTSGAPAVGPRPGTPVPASAATPPASGRPRRPDEPGTFRRTLHVSTETMPYLLDHCFFRQPADWPDNADRWPVVPATTVIQHMVDTAEQAAPGRRGIGLRNARFNRWVVAAPAQDVEITARPSGPDAYAVTFGGFSQATVDLGTAYPAERPEPWRYDPAAETAPEITAEFMYTDRWMFHGPQFHGVTELLALGEMHARGVLTTPAAPGALLDNVGQMLGYWILSTQTERSTVLPIGVRTIRFFGPHPAPGTELECVVRITALTDTELVADAQLIDGDQVWAQFEGWVDRRFDSHPQIRPAERFPERHAVSQPQPEGWVLAFDLWGDHVATRQLGARNILGGAGYLEYEKVPTKARKQWLLGRIAAKDAVRYTLWAGGTAEVFPAELTVANESTGRPRVYGRPGKGFGDFDVSLAHCAEAGVAIARPLGSDETLATPGVGIDVAEVTEHPDSTLSFALSAAERALLAETAAATGDGRWVWFARFWTAKEAVAKAEGTGLGGNPQRFTVVAATPAAMTVEVDGRRYRVEHREVDNPKELTPRRYVVGWTWGPQPTGARPAWVTYGSDHQPAAGTPNAIRQQGPDNGGDLA